MQYPCTFLSETSFSFFLSRPALIRWFNPFSFWLIWSRRARGWLGSIEGEVRVVLGAVFGLCWSCFCRFWPLLPLSAVANTPRWMVGRFSKRALGGLLRFCTQSSPLGRGGGGQILQGGANSFCIQLHHQLLISATRRPLLPWCVISVDIRSLAYKVPRMRSMEVCNHNMVHVSERVLRCVQNKS